MNSIKDDLNKSRYDTMDITSFPLHLNKIQHTILHSFFWVDMMDSYVSLLRITNESLGSNNSNQ